jgi:hypothetical protein
MTTPIVHETVRQIRKLAATGDGRRGRETPRRLPDSPLPPTQLEMETAKAEAEFKLKAQYPVRPYAVLTEG